MDDVILTVNAGSSSLKLAVFGSDLAVRLRGGLDSSGHLMLRDPAGQAVIDQTVPHGGPEDSVAALVALFDGHLLAAGHRVVHGGAKHIRPARVDPALLQELEALVPLAPLHQTHNLAPIRALTRAMPNLPQVACFDTSFHHTMLPVATRFALPREWEAAGVRRYGAHGLSYEFIASHLAATDPVLAAGRVVVAHLGSGASLCAMHGGRSVDTTMGMTPLDGLIMGTRCGSLDPGVVLYLLDRGMSGDAIQDLLYHHSGLLGLSGKSARITETATRVRIAFAAACSEAALFASLARCLQPAEP